VLLKQLGPISAAADPEASGSVHGGVNRALLHASGGIVLLLVVQVLGVYKPGGLTRYGRRKA
jgi:hypothetical protein